MELIRLSTGTVRGRREDGVSVFYHIPYAAAPVGPLRWAPPASCPGWEGELDCTRRGSRCFQAFPPAMQKLDRTVPEESRTQVDYVREFHSNPDFPDPPESEDSLTLNIWTPAKSSSEALSVAVWIHGGAFSNGSSAEVEFDGAAYARRGVILVSIQYRLGLLGFFSHPDLIREQGTAANYGLLDQLAALRWVHENIRAFGGDPEKVTLFGQSAGCMSVQYHLCAPQSAGLFQQVILQSGGGYRSSFGSLHSTLEEAAQAGLRFGKKYFGTESIDELRKLPPEQLREALVKEHLEQKDYPAFVMPAIGGHMIAAATDDLVAAGCVKKLPAIIGSTSEDMMPEAIQEGAVNWAVQMAELGAPIPYVYHFSHQPLGDRCGAFHSSELWYMFGTLDRSWRPKEPCDFQLSQEMLDRWCAFIKTGTPNTDSLSQWQPYTTDTPEIYNFCLRGKR